MTTTRSSRTLAALALLVAAGPLRAQSERIVTKLADNVYLIEHRDAQDGFAGGNSTVIIGDRQVLVVDAPFLPSEAREDIAQIRRWTDKPVAFLLVTHFHNDHNLGNRAYMDAFPALTVIAHIETKRDMDRFGPGSLSREQRGTAAYRAMLASGKNGNGAALTAADRKELESLLARRAQVERELEHTVFQSATLTFERDLTIDLGGRSVEVEFLGRGNTPGDAIAYLPAEHIVAVGDLVVRPMPYLYDGYPSEWAGTLRRLAALDATTIVPGHGHPMHDAAYVTLLSEWMKSAVDQLNEALRRTGPAMFRTVDDVRGQIDLSSFRARFAGDDKNLQEEFDQVARQLIVLAFREASLR